MRLGSAWETARHEKARRSGPSSFRVFADKGYDAEPHRDLCRFFGAGPWIDKRGQPPGSGLGQRRWPVERSNAWGLETKRLALRYDRLGFIIQSLLQSACIFLVAGRLARQF